MKTKLLCALLACISVFSLASCNDSTVSETAVNSETQSETQSIYPSPDYSDKADVMSINGKNVTYEEYRYYFLNIKTKYDRGDVTYWERNDYNEDIKAEVLTYLARQSAIESLAAEYNIALNDDELKQLDEMIASNKAAFDDDNEYNEYLDYLNMTDRVNYRLAKVYTLEQKLFAYLTGEESDFVIHYAESLVRKFIETHVFRGDWIIIYNDYGDDKNENKTLAELIIENVNAGEDFATLKSQYSEDTNTNSNPDGQLMISGEYDKEIENAVKSLQVGKMSGVIETPFGYIIAKRMDIDEKYIENNLHTVLVPYYQQSMFEIMLDKHVADQQIEYFDIYSSLNVDTVE